MRFPADDAAQNFWALVLKDDATCG